MSLHAAAKSAGDRVKTFHDRLPLLGPVIWWLSISYFVAQVYVSRVWKPHYSFINNSISDLGITNCTPQMCSPRHATMNASFIVLGLVMATGSLLICQEFREKAPADRLAAYIGFTGVAVGGVGALVVGLVPENTIGALHFIGAALAIGVGNVGIGVLGWRLEVLPAWLRWYMVATSGIAFVAGVLFAFHADLGIGGGLMERIGAYPEVVWLSIFGVYISVSHYATRPRPVATVGA
jgi:hypothetical membrane protein